MGKGLLASLLVALGIVTYRNAKVHAGPLAPLPLPSQYVAPLLLWGVFSILPSPAGATVGWAVDLGLFLNLWQVGPNGKPSIAPALPFGTKKGTTVTHSTSGPQGPPSNPTGPAGPVG